MIATTPHQLCRHHFFFPRCTHGGPINHDRSQNRLSASMGSSIWPCNITYSSSGGRQWPWKLGSCWSWRPSRWRLYQHLVDVRDQGPRTMWQRRPPRCHFGQGFDVWVGHDQSPRHQEDWESRLEQDDHLRANATMVSDGLQFSIKKRKWEAGNSFWMNSGNPWGPHHAERLVNPKVLAKKKL
jgi:hypothetical protein